MSESDILKQCLRGDPRAWDRLFDEHYAATGRFVFQLGADFTAEDVEEICQETFLSVVKNLGSFKGGSRLQTWIFRIAANKARDYRQKQLAAKRGGGHTPLSLDAEDPETGRTLDVPSNDVNPAKAVLKQEDAMLLGRALEQLDPPCREVIELRYFGDLSYDEISSALDLNVKTVSSRLSKCLDKLEALARSVFSGSDPAILPSNQ